MKTGIRKYELDQSSKHNWKLLMPFVDHGIKLASLFLCSLFLIVLVTHWGSFTSILRVKGVGDKGRGGIFEAILFRTKLLLLKVSGASDIDITHDDDAFLDARRIQETYFAKYPARVAWQLFSYYMVYCFVLVLLAKPIDIQASLDSGRLVAHSLNLNGNEQIISIVILAATNVVTDILSLAITYSHITQIAELHAKNRNLSASVVAAKDIFYAFSLFVLSQLISNVLYPLSLESPPPDFNPFSVDAAFMPYAFVESASSDGIGFYNFVFPGQLFITGTVFVPTVLVMFFMVSIGIMSAVLGVIHRIQARTIDDDTLLEILHPTGPSDLALRLSSRARTCIAFAVNGVFAVFTSLLASAIFLYAQTLFN